MFNLVKMRRAERACEERDQVLKAFGEGRVLTLALKDEPYPYAVPVNYAPMVKDDELYLIFHGALAGRRAELIRRDARVGFTILLRDDISLRDNPCQSSNFFRSLAGEGEVQLLEGDAALEALAVLMLHLGSKQDPEALKAAIAPRLKTVLACALKVTAAGLKEHARG